MLAKRFLLLRFCLSFLTLIALRQGAFANGRPPNTTGIAVSPQNSNLILAGVTFGAIVTRDGGKAWHWICEEVLGGPIATDAVVAITAHERLWVGNVLGLYTSEDRGCSWRSAGPFAKKHMEVRHIARHPLKAGQFLVVVNDVSEGRGRLFESRDNGAHFAELGTLMPGLYAYGADYSRHDPTRIVVAASNNRAQHSCLLAMSNDRGKHFTVQEVVGAPAASAMPRVAFDPTNANSMVVGAQDLKTGGSTFLTTHDAGRTWKKSGESPDVLRDLAWSEDGSTAFAGTESHLLVAVDHGDTFALKTSPKFNGCVAVAHQKLYMCGSSRSGDGFNVGVSDTAGAVITPLGTMESLQGPTQCAASDQTFKRCMPLWPDEAASILTAPVPPHAEEQAEAHEREETERQENARRALAEAKSRQTQPAQASSAGCHCNALSGAAPSFLIVLGALACRGRRRRSKT